MRTVSCSRWVTPVGVIVGRLGCVRAQPAAVIPADLPWVPFRWVAAVYPDFRLERAALVIPTPIGRSGRRSLLQLDLAARGTMPLGFPGPRASAPAQRKGASTASLRRPHLSRSRHRLPTRQ